MGNYEEELKALQAEAREALQRDLARAAAAEDPLRHDRTLLLLLLVRARLAKGLSQAALADKLGMRQPAIARLESGRGNPTLNTLLAIAQELDVQLVVE